MIPPLLSSTTTAGYSKFYNSKFVTSAIKCFTNLHTENVVEWRSFQEWPYGLWKMQNSVLRNSAVFYILQNSVFCQILQISIHEKYTRICTRRLGLIAICQHGLGWVGLSRVGSLFTANSVRSILWLLHKRTIRSDAEKFTERTWILQNSVSRIPQNRILHFTLAHWSILWRVLSTHRTQV